MRKAIIALTGLVLVPFAAGGVVSAQDYPPEEPVVTVGDTTPAPGEDFSVTLQGCVPPETVSFTVEGSSDTATCEEAVVSGFVSRPAPAQVPGTGAATGTLTAPTAPGTYVVTATGLTSGITATFTIEVVGEAPIDEEEGTLPGTGSSSSTPLQVGAVLALSGIAIVGVAKFRRRTART